MAVDTPGGISGGGVGRAIVANHPSRCFIAGSRAFALGKAIQVMLADSRARDSARERKTFLVMHSHRLRRTRPEKLVAQLDRGGLGVVEVHAVQRSDVFLEHALDGEAVAVGGMGTHESL